MSARGPAGEPPGGFPFASVVVRSGRGGSDPGQPAPAGGFPFASVVVPTYNRPRQLAACLESLVALDYPRDRLEVIVVEDGSAVADAAVARVRNRLAVSLLRQPNAGPAAARNAGCARARGAILAFTDDDCRVHPAWLRGLAGHLAAEPDAAVGGCVVNALPDNPCSAASQLLVTILYRHYNREAPRIFTSNNLAFRADRLRAAGGFDAGFRYTAGEDRELCDRWAHQGRPLRYAPDAVVFHAHHLTPAGFWAQHFTYGRGAERFHRVRAARGQPPLRPAPGLYLDLVRHPLAHERLPRALLLAALLGVAQVANAAGALYEAGRVRAIRARRAPAADRSPRPR